MSHPPATFDPMRDIAENPPTSDIAAFRAAEEAMIEAGLAFAVVFDTIDDQISEPTVHPPLAA